MMKAYLKPELGKIIDDFENVYMAKNLNNKIGFTVDNPNGGQDSQCRQNGVGSDPCMIQGSN